jgi:hypothetical protein
VPLNISILYEAARTCQTPLERSTRKYLRAP